MLQMIEKCKVRKNEINTMSANNMLRGMFDVTSHTVFIFKDKENFFMDCKIVKAFYGFKAESLRINFPFYSLQPRFWKSNYLNH